MASSKTDLFDPDLISAAQLFKALAHPARLAILKHIAESRQCITGDISGKLPLSRTTINQHLTELKNIGLIQGTVDGAKVNYCLNPEKVRELGEVANFFFGEINPVGECACC